MAWAERLREDVVRQQPTVAVQAVKLVCEAEACHPLENGDDSEDDFEPSVMSAEREC
jgi:hypothetical protein